MMTTRLSSGMGFGSFKAEGHEVVVDVTPCGEVHERAPARRNNPRQRNGRRAYDISISPEISLWKENHRPLHLCSHVHSVAGVDFRFLYHSLAVSVSFSR